MKWIFLFQCEAIKQREFDFVSWKRVRPLISGVFYPYIQTMSENSFVTIVDTPSHNYVPKS